SGPCKPLLSGCYRSPQSNYSAGGKVVVLDFGNSEDRFKSCESFFGVNHSEGSRHFAYEFPNDSPFSGSYIHSGPMVLDFKNGVTRSEGAGNELRRTDAHKSTPSNGFKVSGSYSVGDQCRDYFRQCGILCTPGECSSGGTSRTRKCTPVSLPIDENDRGANVRWGQPQSQTDTGVCFSPVLYISNVKLKLTLLIDRRGLDVIHNKKQKRTRSSSVGSGHHEAADGVNHRDVTGSYIDIGDCEWVCEYCSATFWYGERVKRDNNFLRPHYHRCCDGEKVVCKWPREPPAGINEVFKNKGFQENIRAYNQMIAMTSFGACIDDSVNRRRGPYVFKISGQIYHWIGSLCPEPGNPPRLFRAARDRVESGDVLEFHIRLFSAVGAREYDLPTSGTLGAIMFENGPNTRTDYDVIIESRGGFSQRVNKLHPLYMSLQFPLLFVYGEPGFYLQMKQ
nr:helitron helicase-like domain-containing protein [Tanacetum cinerariifolium]